MKKLVILMCILLFSSCSSIKFNFENPQELPFEIISYVGEKKDWEVKFLKDLFRKYDITEINERIVLKKEIKSNYTNAVWVYIKTSNEFSTKSLVNSLKNRNISGLNREEEIINNHVNKTSIEFLYYFIKNENIFKERLLNVLGLPKKNTERNLIWHLNDYEIKLNKKFNTITIQLNYK